MQKRLTPVTRPTRAVLSTNRTPAVPSIRTSQTLREILTKNPTVKNFTVKRIVDSIGDNRVGTSLMFFFDPWNSAGSGHIRACRHSYDYDRRANDSGQDRDLKWAATLLKKFGFLWASAKRKINTARIRSAAGWLAHRHRGLTAFSAFSKMGTIA